MQDELNRILAWLLPEKRNLQNLSLNRIPENCKPCPETWMGYNRIWCETKENKEKS
jgi:hypothetical protein